MSDPGEVLQLLQSAGSRWQTARLVRRDREYREVELEWLKRRGAVSDIPEVAISECTETTTRRWFDRPRDRERLEFCWDGSIQGLWVRDGERVCQAYDRDEVGGFSQVERWLSGSAWHDRFLEPPSYWTMVSFELAGGVTVAGRDALVVRGAPQGLTEDWGPIARDKLLGVDELVWIVDTERGTLLSEARYVNGRPIDVCEVTEIAFDEEFDDELFEMVSPG